MCESEQPFLQNATSSMSFQKNCLFVVQAIHQQCSFGQYDWKLRQHGRHGRGNGSRLGQRQLAKRSSESKLLENGHTSEKRFVVFLPQNMPQEDLSRQNVELSFVASRNAWIENGMQLDTRLHVRWPNVGGGALPLQVCPHC